MKEKGKERIRLVSQSVSKYWYDMWSPRVTVII